jgi:hypothetical protein
LVRLGEGALHLQRVEEDRPLRGGGDIRTAPLRGQPADSASKPSAGKGPDGERDAMFMERGGREPGGRGKGARGMDVRGQ